MFLNLRRTSIAKRFSIGTSTIVALLAITTLFRIIYPVSTYKTLSAEIRSREEKISLSYQVGNSIDSIVSSIVMLHLVVDEPQKNYLLSVIKNDSTQVQECFTSLKRLTKTDRGNHLLSALINLYNDTTSGAMFFITSETHQKDDHALLINSLINFSAQYHAQLNRYIEFQQSSERDTQNLTSNAIYTTITYEVVVNITVAILLFFIALWIVPSINKPIREISRFVGSIGHGKVPDPMDGEWAGEFEDIRRHLNIMSEAINALFTLDHYALQVTTKDPLTKLDLAIQCHVDWKMKLSAAVHNREPIDVAVASSEHHCHLGGLLYGEIKDRYSELPGYAVCVAKHAEFHKHAGEVAKAINAGKYAEAEKALEHGAYVDASFALSGAINRIKLEAGV